jgi:hypothetical protein
VDRKNAPVTALGASIWRSTLSGAQVRQLSDAGAKDFLTRYSAPLVEQAIRLALGAYDDSGSLIGVLVLTGPSNCVATVHLAVVPERRRLKLGTDLLHAVAADYPEILGRRPRLCPAIPPEIAEGLCAALLSQVTGHHRPSQIRTPAGGDAPLERRQNVETECRAEVDAGESSF